MTWSIVHDVTYDVSSGGRNELLGWDFYIDTYLPTKGWSTYDGETGGSNVPSSDEKWFGMKRTFTSYAGSAVTKEEAYIVELEGSAQDITIYNWDGSVGTQSGRGGSIAANTAYTPYITSGTTHRWIIMESDQDTDTFMVFVQGHLLAYSFNLDILWPGTNDTNVRPNLVYAASGSPTVFTASNTSFDMNGLWFGNTTLGWPSGMDYFGTQFGFGLGDRFYGFANRNDTALRKTAASLIGTDVKCINSARTFQAGSDYWLDLAPDEDSSFCLNTGTNNYNDLNNYVGMP